MYVRGEQGKRHGWRRVAGSAVFVDVVEEAHELLEVSLLVVDVGEVTAVGAVVVPTIGQLMGHRFQVGRSMVSCSARMTRVGTWSALRSQCFSLPLAPCSPGPCIGT